jgi:hypothetical protein
MITNCYTARSAPAYHAGVRIIAFLLLAAFTAGSALAQPAWKREGRERAMKQEERERMRQDMRDAYRERDRRERPDRGRQMTEEERDKLRRDIENANRELRRR